MQEKYYFALQIPLTYRHAGPRVAGTSKILQDDKMYQQRSRSVPSGPKEESSWTLKGSIADFYQPVGL